MNTPETKTTRAPKDSAGTTRRTASPSRKPIAVTRQPVASTSRRRTSVPPPETNAGLLASWFAGISQFVKKIFGHRRTRKLELHEMQQLGEKRFVAIVRVGKQKFLIGGAATSVSLLAEIDADKATAISPRPLGEETA